MSYVCVASYITFHDNQLYSFKLELKEKTIAAAYEACYRKVKESQGEEAAAPENEYSNWIVGMLVEIGESPEAETSDTLGAELFNADEQFTVVWLN